MVDGDTECARATSKAFGTKPSTHSLAHPSRRSRSNMESEKKMKNRKTPCGVSPKPYVVQTALAMESSSLYAMLTDDRSHDLTKSTA
eukprot:4180978-Prymnesium_polylepis.1